MHVTLALPAALVFSALAIRLFIPIAPGMGLVDRPGGHKQHQDLVPLVGGLGIYVAVVGVLGFATVAGSGLYSLFGPLLVGTSLLFIVGLIDDIRPLSVGLRFGAQAVAATITALWGGILLRDFGALVGSEVLLLGVFALPMTLFATAGVINALNMVDGVDGLSGSLSFVTLLLLAVVAYFTDATAYLLVILTLLGAVGGFLVFNLRCCGRRSAKVFLGDAGSTLLGFLLACLLVGMSQGESRAMSPVTALWLFAVPLYDTTAIMLRRAWSGKSPFDPDRRHLHHLLLDSGFTVPQSVTLMSLLQLLLGCIGLLGWHSGLPEWWMFAGFLGSFFAYLVVLGRPLHFVAKVRRVHRRLELPVAGASGIFIGNLPTDGAEITLQQLLSGYLDAYSTELFSYQNRNTDHATHYAVVHIDCEQKAPRVLGDIRRRCVAGGDIVIRQLIPRDERHDRRRDDRLGVREKRRADRRSGESRLIARHPPAGRVEAFVNEVAPEVL